MPDVGESVRSDKANTFTDAPQTIKKDADLLLKLYRDTNANHVINLDFVQKDSANNETVFARIQADVNDVTDTTEKCFLNFANIQSGTLKTSYGITDQGAIEFGGTAQSAQINDTGLTGGRSFTFPDIDCKLHGNGDIDTFFKDNTLRINNPADSFAYRIIAAAIAADRSITLPLLTADDTAVTQAFAQTLTNKTIDARSNTKVNVAVNPLVKRWGAAQPSTVATAVGCMNFTGILGGHVGTAGGSASVTFDTTEGVIANYISAASSGVQVGVVAPNAVGSTCRRLFGCKMSARVKIDSTTTARMYVGFANAAVAISDSPIGSGVPGVLVGFTAAATNFEIYQNDATGTMTTTAITGPIAKNANWHTIEINWAASGNVDVVFDGTTQTLSSNIPLTTNDLFFNAVAQTSAATARTLSVHSIWIECDK